MLTNEYLKRVYDGLAQRNANEPEFLQAVREVLESIQPVVEKHPEYEKAGLICVSGDLGAAYMCLQLMEREKAVFQGEKDVQPDFAGKVVL